MSSVDHDEMIKEQIKTQRIMRWLIWVAIACMILCTGLFAAVVVWLIYPEQIPEFHVLGFIFSYVLFFGVVVAFLIWLFRKNAKRLDHGEQKKNSANDGVAL